MYTQEQWEHFEKMYDELETFGYAYVKAFGGHNEDFASIRVEGGYIELNTESYYSGCGTDYDSYTLPVSYLNDENWIEKEKARIEEKRIAQEKADNQRKIDKRNKEIEIEKAKYLELQAKYGDQV